MNPFEIVLTKDLTIGEPPYTKDYEIFIIAGAKIKNFNTANYGIEVLVPKLDLGAIKGSEKYYLEGNFAKKVWNMAMEHDRSTVVEKKQFDGDYDLSIIDFNNRINKKTDPLYTPDDEANDARDKRRMIEAHIRKSDKRLEVATALLAGAIAGNSHIEPEMMVDSAIQYADILIKKIYE